MTCYLNATLPPPPPSSILVLDGPDASFSFSFDTLAYEFQLECIAVAYFGSR